MLSNFWGTKESAWEVFALGSNFNGLTPDCNLITLRCEGIQPTVGHGARFLFHQRRNSNILYFRYQFYLKCYVTEEFKRISG